MRCHVCSRWIPADAVTCQCGNSPLSSAPPVYREDMVQKLIKLAKEGPFIEIPDGDILKWLEQPDNG